MQVQNINYLCRRIFINYYETMNTPKIALVKQEVYQDLYVCPVTEKDAGNILFSSQGRVGPIGLIAELGADFYIVKEEMQWETQIYRRVIPHMAKYLYMLKTQTLDKIPGQEFKRPGSPHANGEFAVSCYDVDWGKYDIVISINVSLPGSLVRCYPCTLFAYMIGEANMATRTARFGYDVTLNQMARGIVAERCGVVDFPYTFVNGDTLQRIMEEKLGRQSKSEGVFMEINSTRERPVTKIPKHFIPLQESGQKIILHKQLISENLESIFDARYFVKMGGRNIRGNSAAEAISLGTLVIMNRDEIIHKELITKECNVKTMDDVIALISRLENNPDEYARLLKAQQQNLEHLFFRLPLKSLENCLRHKRRNGRPARSNLFTKLLDHLVFIHP